MDLFSSETNNSLLPFDGEVYSTGYIFDATIAEKLFDKLLCSVAWEPDRLVMFGKEIVTKRKMAWYGDKNSYYTYSNKTKIPLPWIPEILHIKKIVEERSGAEFNACLLNLYHNGQEGMGWHSDDEKEMGMEPVIASLSLGATRNFVFKHKRTKKKVSLILESGSLIIMKGKTQNYWQHSIPKTTKVKSPRINLTFRKIV